jgi:CDP-diacylglycerol--glycerol-3-phosphate 3-phosphatidyltransferase
MDFFTRNRSNFNVPNTLSMIRLLLAVAVALWIEWQSYWPALIGFLIAASTDFIDGWWARRFQQITKLGRILDPFVDKAIIAGAMIALVRIPESGVMAWMASVVVLRELLVTSLRGMVEGAGGDFSAKQLGKWKMVLQCAAVAVALWCLIEQSPGPLWLWLRSGTLWAAIVLTVLSGIEYVLLVVRAPKPA